MPWKVLTTITTTSLLLLVLACSAQSSPEMAAAADAPPAHAADHAAAPSDGPLHGKVQETMDAGGYTYARIATGDGDKWLAGPKMTLQVGAAVKPSAGSEMRGFESRSLGRTFESIFFVETWGIDAAGPAAGAAAGPNMGAKPPAGTPNPHGGGMPQGAPDAPKAEIGEIAKAEGGYTVQEIFDGKAKLAGKEVAVRAKVVKYSPAIMGSNWLHLQDGSGDPKTANNDLVVTTSGTADVGDTVLVRGKVAVDKDFGYGYSYKVMIEGAAVSVE
jgi:hypothetical protein